MKRSDDVSLERSRQYRPLELSVPPYRGHVGILLTLNGRIVAGRGTLGRWVAGGNLMQLFRVSGKKAALVLVTVVVPYFGLTAEGER
jgi:hypothetical protein